MSNKKAIWSDITKWLKAKRTDVLHWAKGATVPDNREVSIYEVIRFIKFELGRDSIVTRANSVAFSIFIAVFPFLIFLFTLLPHIPISADYLNMLDDYIRGVLPKEAADYLMEIIVDLVTVQRGGLLSFGFFLALFFASNGVLNLMYGFDKFHPEFFKDRSYLRKRLVAVGLTIILSILFITSFVLLIVGNLILERVQEVYVLSDTLIGLIAIVKYIVALMLLYTGISMIYKFGPSFKNRIRYWNSGAVIATVLILLIALAFSFYVNNFANYNRFYGSIGALIMILLWLQFNAIAMLIGFEYNAGIKMSNDPIREIKKLDDD